MTAKIATCRIWGDNYNAIGYVKENPRQVVVDRSDRAGGGYTLPATDVRVIDSLDDGQKARLTTWLVDQRLQGDNRPTVTGEIVEYAVSRGRTPIYERADRLLRFMSQQTGEAGELIALPIHSSESDSHIPTNPIFLGAMAWSESTSPSEISYLAGYLEEEGWVFQAHVPFGSGGGRVPTSRYRVTVRGHARVGDRTARTDPSQVFVAMWFDDSVRTAYDEGIEPAIRDCGYESKRIDRDLSVDKIDDAIIAEIKRSRFLVADFTHGKKGPRGGIYYEAGYAHGLGIPVIFTCRRDIIAEIHFDTRQYAHILWDNPGELRIALRDRIMARIEEGPKRVALES